MARDVNPDVVIGHENGVSVGQRKDVGYVPSGLHKYEGIGHAPFSGYTMPWVPNNPSFSQEAFAYILAAVVGLALIFTVVFALKVLSKRGAVVGPGPSSAWGD